MQTLEKVLQQAQQSGVAIGHFNISDLVLLKAVFAAGKS
jgi:fructose-bisphosphate aldolase, class II